MMTKSTTSGSRLVILYGIGGLSDVGRHAVQVASSCLLQTNHTSAPSSNASVKEIVVLTKFPELLKETNWNCGCLEPHDVDKFQNVQVVPVQEWNDPSLSSHFQGAVAIVSCLGHRQSSSVGINDANQAMTDLILPAMQQHFITRLVAITSVGIEEDKPPLEFFFVGRIALSLMFKTVSRRAYHDLTQMERSIRQAPSTIDHLLVRPVGIGEDVPPSGKWQVQQQKYHDPLGFNMAKLDVARFMVQQAFQPTYHRTAVVIGDVKNEQHAETYKEDFLRPTTDSTS